MNIIIGIICIAFMLTGAFTLVYQIYYIVLLDATARGLKHPKLWGFLAIGGNNSSGILMYLIGRHRYPVIQMSDTAQNETRRRKKAAGVSLAFIATGACGLCLCALFPG